MYTCTFCGNNSKPGQPQFKVVTETRPAKYHHEPEKKAPFTTQGTEIVQEMISCKSCYHQVTGENPISFMDILNRKMAARKEKFRKLQAERKRRRTLRQRH